MSFSEASSQASSRDRASHVTGAVFLSLRLCLYRSAAATESQGDTAGDEVQTIVQLQKKKELSGDLTMLLTLLFISTGKNIHIPRFYFGASEAVV